MIEAKGDLWKYPAKARCITTNGIVTKNNGLVMGKGVALQAKERYPKLPFLLADHINKNGNIPWLFADIGIISFPTKNHWRDKSSSLLIKNSAIMIRNICDGNLYWDSIVMTPPGCGNGGLDWKDVKPILEEYFDDRFTVLI